MLFSSVNCFLMEIQLFRLIPAAYSPVRQFNSLESYTAKMSMSQESLSISVSENDGGTIPPLPDNS